MAAIEGICDVVIVGCGLPGRGMGWYHARNLLDGLIPSGKLSAVIEPYFLGAGAETPGGVAFAAFAAETPGVAFLKSVGELEVGANKTVALIAGRTADNPRLLREVIDAGCSTVYLEKPGAPTVGELEAMAEYAESKNVAVYMGYNKNVTKYVDLAREAETKAGAGATTAFYHNNAYKPEELPECFERNAEGMLKNMAVHELALLVTYYGVRSDNIASVVPDKEFSSCQTLGAFTDFDKIGFELTTTEGRTVSVFADRCGGSFSEAVVSSPEGVELARTRTPDAALEAACAEKEKAHPDWMPYFHLQHDDYITLKERVCAAALAEGTEAFVEPEGVASIGVAVETLKVAEYLTPLLQDQLLHRASEFDISDAAKAGNATMSMA